jgi:hypothetical protein
MQKTAQNVPNAEVKEAVAVWKGQGATDVVVTPNPDGATSNLTATFPDPAPGKTG